MSTKFFAKMISLFVVLLISCGRPDTFSDRHQKAAAAVDETEQSNAEFFATANDLNNVGTLDVTKCWALVTITVATFGKAAAVSAKLGLIGKAIAAADNAVKLTIAGWLAYAGIEAAEAAGLANLLVKALELAGLPTAGKISKVVMMGIINAGRNMIMSCVNVALVYYDGVKSVPNWLGYGLPDTQCGDAAQHKRYVTCQSVCGSSLSYAQKKAKYANMLPRSCKKEPTQSLVIGLFSVAYRNFCWETYCTGTKNAYTNKTLKSVNQCMQVGLPDDKQNFLNNLAEECQDNNLIARFLGKQ